MKAKKTILRYQMSVLKKRLQEMNPLIQVMVGPRQIGKTTMVKQVLTKHKNAIYVSSDMLLSADVTWIIEQWNRAKKVAEKEKSAVVLAIDEKFVGFKR